MDDVEAWSAWLRDVRRVRGATLDAYTRTLVVFREWLGHSDWSAVTAQQIEAFMGRERRGGVIGSPATQDRDRIAIGGFYKWLQSRGLTLSNPIADVGVPRVRNRNPRAVADNVWSQLWSSPMPDEDRVWLGLGCFVGLRRREIVSIAPTQVDEHRGFLLYLERKGGNEDIIEFAEMARIVGEGLPIVLPNPDQWIELVYAQARQRRGERCLITLDKPASTVGLQRASFMDPDLPDPGVLNKRLVKLLRNAGLPPTTFSPHALRHTCVQNLLRVGVPIEVVSDVVGHANIDTTRRYIRTSGRLADWRNRFDRT